jgi:dolichol-phosphate mannosyltransferase
MKKVVIISPTYNERENIKKLIPLLETEIFPKIQGVDIQLLIVDDNSPDGTADEVREFQKKWKNIELLLGQKAGLGAAYIRGMEYAMEKLQADAVIEFDADFQHNPEDIPRLIAAMQNGADYVIGSRYIKGGQIPKEWGFDRKVKSILGSMFARFMLFTFSIHDMTSGLKLTSTEYLSRVDLKNLYSKNYAYKLQILYEVVRLGAKVKEVPIIFFERTRGKSKMDTNDLVESFMVVMKLRYRDSQRFIKFLIVGGTGFICQLLFQEVSIRIGFAKMLAVWIDNISFIADAVALANAIGGGIGAEAAIVSNFLFNNFWTFQDTKKIKQKSNAFLRFIKFNLTSLFAIIIQSSAIWFGVKVFGENIYGIPVRILILFPTIILLIIPLNYIIYNKLIWKTQHLRDEKTT